MTKSLSPATRAGQSEDLISEILLRLPVKIILRCKAVSKGWKTLISSHDFVKSHLRRTIASPGADKTLIVRNFDFSVFDVNSGKIVAEINLFDIFKSEFQSIPKYTFLVGSACGIVCVCCSSYDSITYLWIDRTYLWNLATKQSIRIPPPPTIDVENKCRLIGFGFDHVSSDFKFLRMVLSPFCVEVFSANGNCWRKVEQVENYVVPLRRDNGIFVCVKGYLCCARTSHMIAFDLNKEVLNCAIELPVESYDARITEFNDFIAVINWVRMDRKFNIKLWKLDDETSWTLMLSIDHWCWDCVYVYLNKGDFLPSLGDDLWCFCNEKNKERLHLTHHFSVPIFKYMESLVSFTGSKLIS